MATSHFLDLPNEMRICKEVEKSNIAHGPIRPANKLKSLPSFHIQTVIRLSIKATLFNSQWYHNFQLKFAGYVVAPSGRPTVIAGIHSTDHKARPILVGRGNRADVIR